MSNTVRVVLEVILAIALVVAIVLFFNQSNLLTDTEGLLSDAQAAGTTVAENAAATSTQGASDLSDAQATATQAADEAAMALSEANANASQAADDAAAELDDANATATQSADEAFASGTQYAEDLDMLASTATQNADNLAELESAATQSAEDAASAASDAATQAADELNSQATQAAGDAADANATIEAINIDLDDALNVAATASAELVGALSEIDKQATEIAELEEELDAASGSTSNNSTGGEFDLVRHEFRDFAISVPEFYLVLDPKDDVDENVDAINDLGFEYIIIAQLYEQSAENYLFFATPRDSSDDLVFEAISVSVEELDLDFDVDLDSYVTVGSENLGEGVDLIDSGVITLAGQSVGIQVTELDIEGVGVLIQTIYVFKLDNDFYELTFLTTEERYEDDAPLFEAIAASFEILD